MKKVEVEKLVSKSIIITVVLLGLILGTTAIQNGYFNALTYTNTCVATITISVIFAVFAVSLVVLGIIKKAQYYFYASSAAAVAIFVMLLKINYEIKGLQFSVGNFTVKFYIISMGVLMLGVIATWVMFAVKMLKK